MRVSFVSDIHGNVSGLARVAAQAEHLVVLGDLLDYVDYHDHGAGILGAVFGPEKVRSFARLRSAGDFIALRDYNRALWAQLDDPIRLLTEVVGERYAQVVEVLPPGTLLTLGNVDVVEVWNQVAGDRLPYLDGQVIDLAGRTFGFVGGGSGRPGLPRRRPDGVWQPFVRSAEEYRAAVSAVGAVDVLCAHLPPRIAALRYDVVPARMEMYGPGLLESILEHRPQRMVFGHVHQPLARRLRVGRTECTNVGHFQRFPTAFEIDFD